MVFTAALLAGFALDAARAAGPADRRRSAGWLAPGIAVLAVLIAVNLYLGWQNAHLKEFVFDEAAGSFKGVVDWADPAFTPVEYKGYREFKNVKIDMPRAAFTGGSGEVTAPRWLSSRRTLEARSDTGGTIVLRSFWFPGWTARLDGAPLEIRPAPPYGAVSFTVPPGTHTIEMTFEPTPLRRAAAVIGIAFLAITAAVAWGLFRAPVRSLEDATGSPAPG
jgi:hypothetical protein